MSFLITVTDAAIFLMPDGCNLWPPYRCGWSFFEIWRWLSFFQRLDVIALAIFLAYVAITVVYISRRIRLANAITARNDDHQSSSKRVAAGADLRVRVEALRSIARISPFLGLAGVCEGIFGSFYPNAGVVGMAAGLSGTLITTAAGLIVAIPATCFYHYLRSRIGRLEPRTRRDRSNRFRAAQTLPLAKPFSRLPAFSLIAVPCLAISTLAFITIHSAFFFSKGLWVNLLPPGREGQVVIILLTGTDDSTPDIYVNSKRTLWDDLGTALKDELRKSESVVNIRAHNEVRWAYVTEVVDLAERLGTKVVLLPASPVTKPAK